MFASAPSAQDEEPTNRVLVVDDDVDAAETHALMLQQRGLDTAVETDSTAVLGRLADDPIACVVSDYQMPRLDGIELLESIRESHPHLPFILFTGRGSEHVASKALDAGADGYLQKGGTEQYDRLATRVRASLEQARTRAELEETKARFEALTENTPFAVVTIDADGEILYANDAVTDLFGYDVAELRGRQLTTLVPDRLAADHRAGLQRYLETGERRLDWSDVDLPAERRDGSEFPVSISFGEWENESRHLFTGVIRDRSAQAERESLLSRERARFEALFENAPDPILVLDPTADIVEANPAAGDFLGYRRDELVGRAAETLFAGDVRSFAAAVAANGGRDRLQTTCETSDGTRVRTDVVGATIDGDDSRRLLAFLRPQEG